MRIDDPADRQVPSMKCEDVSPLENLPIIVRKHCRNFLLWCRANIRYFALHQLARSAKNSVKIFQKATLLI